MIEVGRKPEVRVTAYGYALQAGMVSDATDPGDLEFLRELGLRAAFLARWEGLREQLVPEGPYQVHTWPERIWSAVADAMARHAAEHGDYGPETVIPPWCPLPQGDQALRAIGY